MAVAALLCAALWAAIGYATEREFAYGAIGVGAAVGYAVRWGGKGLTITYSIAASLLALVGVLVGKILLVCAFIAYSEGLSFWAVLAEVLNDFSVVVEVLAATFDVIDLLFYALAVGVAWRLARRKITEEELMSIVREADPNQPPSQP